MHTFFQNWWVVLLRGLLAIGIGVLALSHPGPALLGVVLFFGIYSLIDGIAAIYVAIAGQRGGIPLWALVLAGFFGIAAAGVAFMWPTITAFALLVLIAISAIVRGVFEIIAAFQMRKVIEHEFLLGLGGVLSIAFGILLMKWPAAGLLSLMWLLGGYAIFFGIVELVWAFRMRHLMHQDQAGMQFRHT